MYKLLLSYRIVKQYYLEPEAEAQRNEHSPSMSKEKLGTICGRVNHVFLAQWLSFSDLAFPHL